MTKRLFDDNGSLLSFEATVLSCHACEEGYELVLDATAFAPEGGGQPSDIGLLDGDEVSAVLERGGELVHITRRAHAVGVTVVGEVDAERRLRHLQNHTGEHIVSGVFYNQYGFQNIGFHLGHEEVTLDLDGEVDEAMLRLVEWRANVIVAEDRRVMAYYPSPEELSVLAYRSKKELRGPVRIVEIEGHDKCACCVPHVSRTGQVGGIRLLSAMRYKGGTRIFMKCGLDAIADAVTDAARLAAISHLLSLPPERLLEGVKKLGDNLAEAEYELTALRRKLADEHADAAEITARTTVLFEEGADTAILRRMADRLAERGAVGAMLCAERGEGEMAFVYLDTSESYTENSAALRAAFPVRGGGKPPFVQGSLRATREQILNFFEK